MRVVVCERQYDQKWLSSPITIQDSMIQLTIRIEYMVLFRLEQFYVLKYLLERTHFVSNLADYVVKQNSCKNWLSFPASTEKE